MKKEMELTLSGYNKEEAYEALEKSKAFINKKPDKKYYRFVYISINDVDGVEHKVTCGGTFSDDDEVKRFDNAYETGKKLLDGDGNFGKFYIAATIRKEK